jgi:hypothetical protein
LAREDAVKGNPDGTTLFVNVDAVTTFVAKLFESRRYDCRLGFTATKD